MPGVRPVLAGILAVLLATLAQPGSVSAHPHTVPPPISYDLSIRKDAVIATVVAEVPVIELWLGERYVHPDDDAKADVLARLVTSIDAHVRLEIDGETTRGEGTKLTLLEAPRIEGLPRPNDMLIIKVRYPTHAPPKKVEYLWTDFTGCLWEGEVQVPSLIESALDVDVGLVSPVEPSHTWWRLWKRGDFSDDAIAPDLLANVERSLRRTAAAITVAAIGGPTSWLAVAFERMEEPIPPMPPPATAADAGQIFSAVHERLFRAFDGGSDSDALAEYRRIVRPEILAPLFGTTREFLILRSQGGARARVERIEADQLEVVHAPEGAVPALAVRWEGKIHLGAGHFGHLHQRILVLDVLYVLRGDEGSWRVHDLYVADATIIDEDAEGNLPTIEEEDEG